MLKPQKNIVSTMRRGLSWSLPRVVLGFGLSVIRSIVLARLLAPEDFGTAGIALAFMQSVSWAGTFGLTAAVLQCKDLPEKTIISAYWAVLGLYSCAGLILAAVSHPIAVAYANDRLTPLLYVCACTVAVQGAQAVPFTLLYRRLKFGTADSILLATQLVSFLVGIAMAKSGHGAASLVVPDLFALIAATFITHVAARFVPYPHFSVSSIKQLIPYAARSQAYEMLNIAYPAIVGVALSYTLGFVEYGLVFFAVSRADRCFQPFISMVRTTLFTALCVEDDKAGAWQTFLTSQGRVIFYLFSMIAYVLIMFSGQIVPWTFGEQWNQASGMFRIACLATVTITVTGLATPYFRSVGAFRLLFIASLVRVLAFVCALLCAQTFRASAETVFSSVVWGNVGFLATLVLGGVRASVISSIVSLGMFLRLGVAFGVPFTAYQVFAQSPSNWLELAWATLACVGVSCGILLYVDAQFRRSVRQLIVARLAY